MIKAQKRKAQVLQDILNNSGRNSFFINMKLKKEVSARDAHRDFALFCLYYPMVIKSIQNRYPDSRLKCTLGISRNFWDHLFPQTMAPAQLKTFKEVKGDQFKAPATEGDLSLHIRSDYQDVCVELLKQFMHFLHPFLESVYEIHGFDSADNRAIIGFVNGSSNPTDNEAMNAVAIGEEDPEYAGSSYLFTQKYIHDMDAWDGLSIEEQERIIGRTKRENTDLVSTEKYENAHNKILRNAAGGKTKILRENVIFSNPSQNEYGTFFISYSRTFDIIERMLNYMFTGNKNPGTHDKLLEYSTAVTGNLFFVPSFELIDKFGKGAIN